MRVQLVASVSAAPAQLFTLSEWWRRFEGAAFQLLHEPAQTFAEDEERLEGLCAAQSVTYAPRSSDTDAAFPAWLLLNFYPDNP